MLIATPTTATTTTNSDENSWLQTICRRNRLTTSLHFYVHDVRTGPNATLYTVANASITANSSTGFGRVNVFDDRVTVAPDINSSEVARAQGLTTSSDLQVQAFTMNLNFFLKEGPFNGSTVSVVGRNQFADAQRELTVVGGTGPFRYARGYAITSTYSHDATINYSVLEYTINLTFPRRSGCFVESS
ncbi:hypothetical protein C2S53_018915 [Perilla frutescens var. hirtella]|uniref:Dirigent protein n=1 Tax=Perilla frutescens var. hirtella TaxID=608512 RepID=A0AAD4NZU1_PERFH|nr:hypothetical protein C2S53_018915 [Perilla frutescens var. hirtella]